MSILFDMAESEQVRTERRVLLGARGRMFNIDGTQFDYTELFLTVPLQRADDPVPMAWGLGVEVLKMPGSKNAISLKQPDAYLAEIQIREYSAGKDVNMVDGAGRPLLAIAAERGQLAIIRELVSRGADLEKKDSRGMTPLFIAAGYNQLPAVQELVVAGATIESRNTELEFTPLMPAAESGYNAVVDYLLSKGADAAARSSDGQTALSRLAWVNARTSQSNNVGTAQLLLGNLRARLSKKAFADWCVDAEMMAAAKPDALFMHCLPAHRGEEVEAEVIDGPQSVVWDEAENRMHAQKALMEYLLLGRIG